MENITINGEFVIKQLLHCEENIDSRIVSASKLAPVPEIKQDECTESITTAMIVFIKEIFLHKTIFYINNLSAINLDEATSKTSGEYLTRYFNAPLFRASSNF
ncbi:unnamed protein product [Meloidogyne enterolobii]|uniref:Uncharacterized protein n=1 Tax=Meloidogyne enterolobii TaxID=390850 RepID=A0ACB0XLS1_MELEN